jgi:hypothetical protein
MKAAFHDQGDEKKDYIKTTQTHSADTAGGRAGN